MVINFQTLFFFASIGGKSSALKLKISLVNNENSTLYFANGIDSLKQMQCRQLYLIDNT